MPASGQSARSGVGNPIFFQTAVRPPLLRCSMDFPSESENIRRKTCRAILQCNIRTALHNKPQDQSRTFVT
jgi:hypothetical protein